MIGKWNKFSQQEIEEIYAQSDSFKEVALKFGYKSVSGQLNNKLRELAKENNIEFTHLEQNKRVDLIAGNIYGNLQYLKDDNERKHYVICKCLNCGEQKSIYKYNLGKQQTCGCNKREKFGRKLIQLNGKTIGNFDVIELDKDLSLEKDKTYWKCRCHFCNNIKSIESYYLRTNPPYSCGCIRLNSKGEQKISDLLTELNISFKREYVFPDLIEYTGHPFRFDFAIFKENKLQLLIEYHGKQHYDENYGWNESYNNILKRDNIKTEYCKNNNIPLIVIPYIDYEKIDTQYLLNKINLRGEINGTK